MTKKSGGRKERRAAAREATRKDGKERNLFAVKQGNAIRVYRAGRKSTA